MADAAGPRIGQPSSGDLEAVKGGEGGIGAAAAACQITISHTLNTAGLSIRFDMAGP